MLWVFSSPAISFIVQDRTLGHRKQSPNLVNISRKGTYWKSVLSVAYRTDRKLEK